VDRGIGNINALRRRSPPIPVTQGPWLGRGTSPEPMPQQTKEKAARGAAFYAPRESTFSVRA